MHHTVLLFVATILVVASFVSTPIASTFTVVTAGCIAATLLSARTEYQGGCAQGRRPGVENEYEDEASASNITTDAAELQPPPPVYAPMEWMLAGPSAGWLIDDPDHYFSDKELAAPPPLMYSCPGYGYGSGLPSLTPSDEDPENFNPPGYDPLPEFSSPPAAVPLDAPKP
ncbi:hypothetical protein TRIUR3_12164 [Triticum urartu]|uniref:Uncharacterized protein n=1 Tax=Triticum urartu TaxID=4572 RepID=M7ZWE3_TRIUA|nr:hypothetical protein TRIUR3_12164 [Triticum urartu]